MCSAVAAVAIGRNEGERLEACLRSLFNQSAEPVVYVDSGSSDGSIEVARRMGAVVVELDLDTPFTAARARNAGFKRVLELSSEVEFIQFIDGDCELSKGWLETAHAVIIADSRLAVVCGRRRERFPEATIWNWLIDREWDTPIGEQSACGGDALIRCSALSAIGGYRGDLIAGEEPEMCFRLRKKFWRILRIDFDMCLHDADMTSVSQWWQRSRRTGHTYAEGAVVHGFGPERYKVMETIRALFWGALVPLIGVLLAVLLSPWFLLLPLSLWSAQIVRLFLKGYVPLQAFFLTVGKLPEAQGAIEFFLTRLFGHRRRIIEYK
ncbi:MAG: glycosyltransferase family A protein [Pseudomonadota bacterium]